MLGTFLSCIPCYECEPRDNESTKVQSLGAIMNMRTTASYHVEAENTNVESLDSTLPSQYALRLKRRVGLLPPI